MTQLTCNDGSGDTRKTERGGYTYIFGVCGGAEASFASYKSRDKLTIGTEKNEMTVVSRIERVVGVRVQQSADLLWRFSAVCGD